MDDDRLAWKSDRRTLLRGLGTLVALPALESMAPRGIAWAAKPAKAPGAPVRVAFLMTPDGVNLEHWRPTGVGKDWKPSRTFQPLAPFKHKLQVMTGFAHLEANAKGDGPGDHARASATFLTGTHPFETSGANVRAGISVDQVIARQIGHLTRLSSLELGAEKSRNTGACDSGYACAYQYNLSWGSPTTPMPPEADPRQVFERLFGAGSPDDRQKAYGQRQQQRKSVIDFVLEETRSMSGGLSTNDRRKIDEYLSSVRVIELEIEKAERFKLPKTNRKAPGAIPEDYATHLRMMFDLLVLAFQSDSTRVATFPLAHEGSNRPFNEIGIPDGHHYLSHHQRQKEKLDKVARIDLFYMEQFAYFLKKLEAAKDVDGRSVLDNSMILYGSGISDGDRHNHNDLPIVLAGGGGGRFHTNRHVQVVRDPNVEHVPLTNLFLTMMEFMGAPTDKLGDSTGRFTDV